MKISRILILLTAAMVFLGGCSGGGKTVKFDIPSGVPTLDPQFATDPAARMIVSNTFETLLRRDADGEIVPSLAESYSVSDDSLVYTFNLRGDAVWYQMRSGSEYSGLPVTASDFQFAIRRMFNPDAPSPFARELLCIENAPSVLAGDVGSDALGVRVIDEHTLEITLERPDSMFTQRLTSSYSAPCNQQFFESTRARYGLEQKTTISNGAFYVRAWDNSETILLRRNPTTDPEVENPISGVNLQITGSDPSARFLDGDSDLCRINFSAIDAAQRHGDTVTPFEDTVWLLIFNQRQDRFANDDIRRALSLSLDHGQLSDSTLPGGLRAAGSLLPPSVGFASGVTRSSLSDIELRQLYTAGMDTLGLTEPPFTELLVSDDDGQKLTASHVQQGFQRSLSLFVNLKPIPQSELMARIKSGDFTAAIVPLTTSSASPASLLEFFRTGAPENFTGYSNPDYDLLLDTMPDDGDGRLSGWRQAEQFLLTDCAAVPLTYETTYFAMRPDVIGITPTPFLTELRFSPPLS